MSDIPHGGRLVAAGRRYRSAPQPWIDLSTGINPQAYPFTPPPPEAWQRLPEPEQVLALEAAAARAYGAIDPAMVVAAPGSQALIQLLPRLFPQPRIAIPGPTYAEHAAAWSAAGTVIAADAPARVLCNPNNPDGARHDPGTLHAPALLVIDEAFADFEPGLSLIPQLPRANTIVLRSLGKAYGLAGLRLGFAITAPPQADRIRDALGPWAINGPAIAIGIQALSDTAWCIKAALAAEASAVRLDILLARAGLAPVGGTFLFRTVCATDASNLANHLAQAGILVRQFAAQPTWLRFGLPGDNAAWTRLAKALGSRWNGARSM